MAAKSVSFDEVKKLIASRTLPPVTIIHGEEGYFVDTLAEMVENMLPEDERAFNLNILYAPRINMEDVPGICQRMPMFSDFQVVLIKEAQSATVSELNVLTKYLANPSPSTVLVLAGRGGKLKDSTFMQTAKKSDCVSIYEAKAIRDRDLPGYISQFVSDRGLSIQPKALSMLAEYIGNDLSKLFNEVQKLTEILGPNASVTPEAIEQHIGFSKTFNSFELVDALAAKDAAKVFRIADYFRANPKAAPLVVVIGSIFGFFSDLLVTYFAKEQSDRAIMAELGIKWDIQYAKFRMGRQRYNAFQVIEIIRAIRAFDRQSKGAGSRRNEHDLFKELMYRILTAPGQLYPKF